MGIEEGPISRRSSSRRHRRPPGDDASSPKRQKRSHHRHHHRHHGHGRGDRGDQESGSRPRVSGARPGEREVEDGEIVDDAAAASRGPGADFGKAGSVFGSLAPAPLTLFYALLHKEKGIKEFPIAALKDVMTNLMQTRSVERPTTEERDLRKSRNNLARVQEGIPMVIILLMQLIVHLPFSQLGFSLDIFEILQGARSSDILCDDIFGVSPIRVQKSGNLEGMHVRKNSLRDNWDDEHGYYKYHLGEVLDGHYRITAGSGKGVFSTVVQAKDLKAGENDPEVAIKIICNEKERYKSGKREVSVLEKLSSADREDKRHCVRFISSFMYRDHLCLVLESLHMNLREVIKKFGRDIGLKLTAVRTYSKQLFIALKHLKDCSILHCDIKPDNILVNGSRNMLKLCDFGSALPAGINDITPILVSRFYRAPEIRKILFPGGTNNGMLWLHMELKGPFPKKMLRKGAFTTQHFDQDLNFHATDENLVKKAVNKVCMNVKPSGVGPKISSFPGEDPKMLSRFKDLLEKIFVLDPQKRLTVSQALSHPFITGK
uniref:Serine/threonine-kinase PRP4-like protein n=1 Tax=Aegilops tauschii TaxID=37682 RepID=N1QQL5_AEGTA